MDIPRQQCVDIHWLGVSALIQVAQCVRTLRDNHCKRDVEEAVRERCALDATLSVLESGSIRRFVGDLP